MADGDMGPPMHSPDISSLFGKDGSSRKSAHKRSNRACLVCRRLKKVCEGGSATNPCNRCSHSGADCVFDKPQSHVIDDAGLDRLSNIESLLASQERRMEVLINTVGDLSARLAEVSSASNGTHSHGGSPAQHAGTPNLGHTYHPSAHSVQDPLLALRSSLLHNSSAYSSQPDASGDSFARRLHMPIAALAEAADRASRSDQDAHPSKRVKLDPMTTKPMKDRADRPDAVMKGVLSEKEARELVALWHKDLQPFCAVLDAHYDNYESLRRRSSFLFNTVLYTAQRSCPSASVELAALAEETKEFAQTAIFDPNPPLENIQAVLLMACWHEEPYLLSGYALRMALASKLDTALEQLDPNNHSDPEGTRHLMARIRCYLLVSFWDWKNSASTGRTPLRSLEDLAQVEQHLDKMLRAPGCTIYDVRTVAAFRQTMIQRSVMQRSGELLASAHDFDKAAYVDTMQRVFKEWFDTHDALLANRGSPPLDWPRRSHLRQLHDSYCFLACTVFRSRLLDPNRSPEVQVISQNTLQAARASLTTSLEAPSYRNTIRFSGFITRIELSFAGLLALKLAPDDPTVANEAKQIAEVLTECFGSMKAANALRYALRTRNTQPTSPTTAGLLDNNGSAHALSAHPASHGSALLPGEALIDWSALTGPSGVANSATQQDWLCWHSNPLSFPFYGPDMDQV